MTERARSFGPVAAAYAEHRPDYPAAAVEWAIGPMPQPRRVLDLGAGTGILTASLATRAASVVAVDPDAGMLAELQHRLPGVEVRLGDAEAIPLPDSAVDAVIVGQAFHWFDPDAAMPEIARVLRQGGVLAALWNSDDDDLEWVAGYHEVASRDRPVPGVPRGEDRPDLPEHDAFTGQERRSFPHSQRLTVDGLIAVLGTHSWALVSEEAARAATYDRIRTYLATRPETSAGEFELPLVTTALRALRR